MLGPLARGDIVEDGRESSLAWPVSGDFIVAPKRSRVTLEVSFLPGQGHPAVPFDPRGFEVRNDFHDTLTNDIGRAEPGQPLESGVHCQESVVARFAAIVEDDLVKGQAVQHLAEENAVILLGGEKETSLFLRLFLGPLAFGDVRIRSKPLKDTAVTIFERHDTR